MTDIEQKALALAIEVREDGKMRLCPDPTLLFGNWEALCRAIEQHEATKQELAEFKQKVSDAVEAYLNPDNRIYSHTLNQFIIPKPKPDPLVEVLQESDQEFDPEWDYAPQAIAIRAALEARGLEIRSKSDD
jgi:hypothetical protein